MTRWVLAGDAQHVRDRQAGVGLGVPSSLASSAISWSGSAHNRAKDRAELLWIKADLIGRPLCHPPNTQVAVIHQRKDRRLTGTRRRSHVPAAAHTARWRICSACWMWKGFAGVSSSSASSFADASPSTGPFRVAIGTPPPDAVAQARRMGFRAQRPGGFGETSGWVRAGQSRALDRLQRPRHGGGPCRRRFRPRRGSPPKCRQPSRSTCSGEPRLMPSCSRPLRESGRRRPSSAM